MACQTPVSGLVFLSICVYVQVVYCVRSWTLSVELATSLPSSPTSGQYATRQPCNQTSLEERRENNIQNTEEVRIGLQLRWGEEEARPLKAKRKCRPKHFKDGEMRGGKFPKLSNGTTDDNGQYIGSSSSNGTTLNRTRVSHDGQRDKRSDGQESCGKDDRAAESLGASPPNCIFVCESTRSDVPNSTSQSSIAVARKFTSTGTYANSVCSSTLSGVGNEETSLSPVCSEVNSASERRMTSEEFDSRLFGPWEEIMKCNKEGRESEEQGKEEESGKDDEMESQKACKHHNRRCEVWFPCCKQFYRCHRCHNSASNCGNDEAKASDATHLKCSRCQFTQEIKENSDVCSRCGVKMAEYFCFPCKSFKGVHKKPYHCDLCGICRSNKDKMYHCEGCSVCMEKQVKNYHKCLPTSDHYVQCCICLKNAFKRCHPWKCGHKVHPKCAEAYSSRKWTTCPLCRQLLK